MERVAHATLQPLRGCGGPLAPLQASLSGTSALTASTSPGLPPSSIPWVHCTPKQSHAFDMSENRTQESKIPERQKKGTLTPQKPDRAAGY